MSTIFALSAWGTIIPVAQQRLGPRSKELLSTLSRKKILQPRQLFFSKLYDHDSSLMDSAMAAYLPGPSTFTGEDPTELYLHGSKAVVDTVAKCLLKFDGLRHAKRGEFTKRLKEADIVFLAVSDAREDDIVLDELLSDLQEVVNGAPINAVKNKADLASNKVPANNQSLSASVLSCALTTKGIEELWANLQRVVDDICPEESGPASAQVELLTEAQDAVLQANSVSDVALREHHLQIAFDCVGELTCSTVNGAVLDRLFAQFYIEP
ncbi:unnamed protein product, partial [Mesorhabditis spiculigera]